MLFTQNKIKVEICKAVADSLKAKTDIDMNISDAGNPKNLKILDATYDPNNNEDNGAGITLYNNGIAVSRVTIRINTKMI